MDHSLHPIQADPTAPPLDVPILIVGAGPTGLTIANVLARAGVAFRIIDQKTGPVVESRAVVMHARTLELLAKLGLADRAVAEGQRIGSMQLYREGNPVGEVTFFEAGQDDRTPYPFALIFEQSKTERLLLQGLEEAGGEVEWSTSLRAMQRFPDHVQAIIVRSDGKEETIEAGWVVGADGAHSPVRHALGLGFAGETYEQTLFLADVDLEWGLPDGKAQAEITRDGFLMFFPMPGERHYRLVGNLPAEMQQKDTITPAEVQQILDRQSALQPRITASRWTSVYRTHHRMAERFRIGRVFLVGDAAHVHSPAGAQGMNTGIGDAYNLGWKLALVAKSEADAALLESYEAERIPFARAILNGTDRGFHLLDTTAPLTRRLKMLAVPLAFSMVSRAPAAQRRLFWMMSQLWTSYRDSPAVAEAGPIGRLPRAGDRAPYGRFDAGNEAGTSIFDMLVGPDHHLLLFAGLRPDPAALEAAREVIALLLESRAAPIRLHVIAAENRQLQERYGADVPTVVLVRPDGQIAFRGDAADIVPLTRYLDRWFRQRPAAELVGAMLLPKFVAH